MSRRDQFVGVVIFQLIELEMTALADAKGFAEQCGRIELGQLLARPQVAFAIGEEVASGLGDRQMVADGGHAVLQCPSTAGMHVHVATDHGGYAQA